MKKLILLLCSFLVLSVQAEQIVMIKSTITGSQEQPKVISIVPWQKPEDPNYFGQESEPLALKPEEFKLLTREEFLTELDYLSVMKAGQK